MGTTFSIPIDAVIAMAEAEGNQVIEISTGWEKVRQLVYMARPMSEKLRTAVTERYPLRFWSADATPHDAAACGFIDEHERVSISFPR